MLLLLLLFLSPHTCRSFRNDWNTGSRQHSRKRQHDDDVSLRRHQEKERHYLAARAVADARVDSLKDEYAQERLAKEQPAKTEEAAV